ncbi:MAG: hypothetical protein DRI80_11155 [Chloroflexota bacterium]|nr:MAG: hypothetical protein DRI80_11155 [Chloroflexota bacterium]
MWAFWVALATMIVGLIGVILPVVPGVGFIWLVVLVYAVAEHFATIDPITFAVLTVLGAIGFTADLWMSQVGAKVGGASVWSLLAGLVLGAIGAIVGLVFLGIGAVPGAIVGAIAGVILAEWYRRKDWREAFKAGGGWLVGCTLSGGVQFLVAILMILIFVWQALKG